MEPPLRRKSASLNGTDDASGVFDDITNTDANETEATTWTAALLPLVKGKKTMDEERMVRVSDTLGKVEHASDQGLITLDMLKVSVGVVSR